MFVILSNIIVMICFWVTLNIFHISFVQWNSPFRPYLMFVPLLQFGSEKQQLEWAKQVSEREEQERLRRLQLQEQQDLELAIALSRADMSGSWAGGTSHLRSSSRSSPSCSWRQHQRWPDITERPRCQFVRKTSDSPAVTGHMFNDSTFNS